MWQQLTSQINIVFCIENSPETLHLRFIKKLILDGKEKILNNNSYQFDNINYIQTLGTTVGNKMAPTFTTLTLVSLGENLYEVRGKNATILNVWSQIHIAH